MINDVFDYADGFVQDRFENFDDKDVMAKRSMKTKQATWPWLSDKLA
jgi:hypothetical protein